MTSQKNQDASPLSRRIFLGHAASVGVVSAIGVPSIAFSQNTTSADFFALSQRLTGTESLDEEIATVMLNAFQRIGKGSAIRALINGEENTGVENEVVASWYNGTSPDPDASNVLAYTDALMWEAMLYTKPMGYCGRGMGYWADPPTT